MTISGADSSANGKTWQSLTSRQRRVLGVLIEKAKTTPDAYPMTLNGIVNGCNQKSNRSPQMTLTADDAEDLLDELRGLGAVSEVQGGGRVAKYRHYGYDWFAVDKRGISVMAELLLRGEQTLGDLRARASRMEPIRDQRELREVIDGLLQQGLIWELTPAGRGQMVTHGLYTEREQEDLVRTFGDYFRQSDGRSRSDADVAERAMAKPDAAPATPQHVPPSATSTEQHAVGANSSDDLDSAGASVAAMGSEQQAAIDVLTEQVAELQDQLREMDDRMAKLEAMLQ